MPPCRPCGSQAETDRHSETDRDGERRNEIERERDREREEEEERKICVFNHPISPVTRDVSHIVRVIFSSKSVTISPPPNLHICTTSSPMRNYWVTPPPEYT